MARLLLIHPSRSAVEREASLDLVSDLRRAQLDVDLCEGEPGLAGFDRALARADKLILVEASRWWPRSVEDRLSRPWLTRISEHVEFDRRNRLGGVAGVIAGLRPRHEPLSGVQWFRRRDQWQALLDWAGADNQPPLPFEFGIDVAIAGDRRRDDVLAAIDAGLAASSPAAPWVAIGGALGVGKTRALRDWLRRGSEAWIVAHHFVLPEHGASQRADLLLRSFAAQLSREANSLDEALTELGASRPGVGILLVLDGLERIDDRERLLAEAMADPRLRWLIGARPGHAPSGAATIDLDRSDWASARELVAALAAEITRLDVHEREALVVRAAGNPSYVAALAEDAGTRTTRAQLQAQTTSAVEASSPILPRAFEAELTRELGRVALLPIPERRRGERILSLLALAGQPLPAAILRACLGWQGTLADAIAPVRGLVRFEGSASEPTLALFHPALGECLRVEIDSKLGLERVLLAAIERAAATGEDASVQAFADTRVADLQRTLGEAGQVDVGQLVESLRRAGPAALERELERAHAADAEGVAGDLLALVRAQRGALVRSADALPGLVWKGLLDRGWSREQVASNRLRWPCTPTIRSRRGLEHVDACWRWLPHPDEVRACAISSEGEQVLSGCEDGWVRSWSRTSGEELERFKHGARVRSCAMTPDARWAVSGGTDDVIKRWDLRTHQLAGECKLGSGTITALAIDDAGACVLAGDSTGKVFVWRPFDGIEKTLRVGSETVDDVAISREGKLGLSVIGTNPLIWDLERDELLSKPQAHEYMIGALTISADQRSGFALGIGESRRISLPSGAIEQRYPRLNGIIADAALMPDSRLIVAQARRLEVWDTSGEGKLLHAVHAHREIQACVAARAGAWLASAGDHDLKIWSTEALQPATSARWQGSRSIVAASPDGSRAIVGGDEYSLSLVELASGEILTTLAIGGRTNQVAWIDDDRLLTIGATSHEVAIWSVNQRKQLAVRKLGDDWLRGAAISPDREQALITGDEQRTWLVELDDLTRARSLGRHPDWGNSCQFSSDGSLALAADNDAELQIWSLADHARRHHLESKTNYSYTSLVTIAALAFAGGNATLDVWDIEAGELLTSPAVHEGKILALALADEGRVLVSAGEDATLRLWKVGRSPSPIATVWGHAPFVSVSLAGSLLLAGDGAGNVWELEVDWRALVS